MSIVLFPPSYAINKADVYGARAVGYSVGRTIIAAVKRTESIGNGYS